MRPESALARNMSGDAITRSLDGYPLGVTVVSRAGAGDFNPSALAVIYAAPGVEVVVTLAITYSCPAEIVTESGTDAMLVWEEVRKMVTFPRVAVGRLFESARETTTAGYTPPSAGSLGGMTVTTTLFAGPGTVSFAAIAGRS
jgi:hypothetical protein